MTYLKSAAAKAVIAAGFVALTVASVTATTQSASALGIGCHVIVFPPAIICNGKL